MGLIQRLLGVEPKAMNLPRIQALGEAPAWALNEPALAAFMQGGHATAAGISVNEHVALRNTTVYRAISLIASSMGMLGLHLMERKPNGSRHKAREHPLYKVLLQRPNSYQTPYEFKTTMQASALNRGNAYALIVRSRGEVRELIPLDARRVEPVLSPAHELTFRYTPAGGARTTLLAEDVFHFRSAMTLDGLKGLALTDVAAEAIGLALQAERAASRIFSRGSMSTGALKKKEGTLSDDAYNRLRASFDQLYVGADNSGRPMLLEEGLEWQSFASNAREAQHIETRKHQVEEVARATGVPRPLLMVDETSWGSGIEQLGLFFVTYCLLPWFVAWEEAVGRSLLTEAERGRFYAKYNDGALLRGSLKDQAEFFAKALGGPGAAGFMVPNEAREKMDMNRIDGGDEPAWMRGDASDAQPTA